MAAKLGAGSLPSTRALGLAHNATYVGAFSCLRLAGISAVVGRYRGLHAVAREAADGTGNGPPRASASCQLPGLLRDKFSFAAQSHDFLYSFVAVLGTASLRAIHAG